MTAIRAAAESNTGYVRSNNEDLAVVSPDLVAVADGMGGHLAGEVAARTAIEELVETFQRDRTAAGLAAAVRRANRAIWRKSRVDRKLHGMGTTLTAAALVAGSEGGEPSHLSLVNVGDSRAYRLDRSGASPSVERLTEDHSVVEEMVRQGELTPAEAAVHPHRHVLTRVLGMDAEVELDVWDLAAEVGTRYLLCSDGLTNEVPEEEIARVLATEEDPRQAARSLVDRALGHGGIDNVTVVVLDIVAEDSAGLPEGVEMVPPRPPMPTSGDDSLGADVTQALPVTRPVAEDPSGTDPRADADAGDGEGPDASSSDSGPSTLAVAAAVLFDGDVALAKAGDAPDGAEETSEVHEVPVANRRGGRSMTVRSAAPAGPAASAIAPSAGSDLAPPGSRGPRGATLLVPTKGLARRYRDRIVTVRVFLFLVALVGLAGGVIGVVIWFQRSSYYVGLDHGRVAIFQGRPGGLLWFAPSELEVSTLTSAELLPNSVSELQHGISETSYVAAKQEVADLTSLSEELGLSASPTTTTTPAAAVTTTSAPAINAATTTPATAAPTTATRPTTTTAAATTTTGAPSTTGAPPTTAAPTTTTAAGGGHRR